MSQPPQPITESSTPDVLDQLTVQPGSALADLRARRPEVARFTQGSYDALLAPADLGGVSLIERELVALRVATLNENASLAAHYQQRLVELNVPATTLEAVVHFPASTGLTARETAILGHVDLLTTEPRATTQAHITALQTSGLSERDIVTLAQLIAFLSYQVRVLVGLQLLAEEK